MNGHLQEETILYECRRIARKSTIVAVALYGSRASGYAREDSDYDVLLVIDRYQPKIRYHYVKTDAGQLAILAVDQNAMKEDVEKGVLGDFVAGRLLMPLIAVKNEEYVHSMEVGVKERFTEEDLKDLILEYGELAHGLTILPAYLVLARMEKRARVYSPLRYSYANVLRPDLKESNLSKILIGYYEALTKMSHEGSIRFDGESIRFQPAFVDRVLSYKIYNKAVNFFDSSRRTFNAYVTHGKAGRVTIDVVAKELASKLKREIQLAFHQQGLEDPKDYLFLATEKGLLSLNKTDSIIEKLGGLNGEGNITAKSLGTALNEVYLVEVDGERLVAKKFTDWYNFKWFILNVAALGTKVFSTQGKTRLSNEYVTNRLLAENGIPVPEVVSISIPDRLLVERYIEGRSLLEVLIEVMRSDSLRKEHEDLAFRVGQILAKIHGLGVIVGDCKPENFILDPRGCLHVLDLEQGQHYGDPAWDVAEFFYFSGHFGDRFSEGFRQFIQAFGKGYTSIGRPKVLADASSPGFVRSFIAWTPTPIIRGISEALKNSGGA